MNGIWRADSVTVVTVTVSDISSDDAQPRRCSEARLVMERHIAHATQECACVCVCLYDAWARLLFLSYSSGRSCVALKARSKFVDTLEIFDCHAMDDVGDSGGGSAMQFLSCGRLFSHALDQFNSRLNASISTLSAAIETVENSLVRPHECVLRPHSPYKYCNNIGRYQKPRVFVPGGAFFSAPHGRFDFHVFLCCKLKIYLLLSPSSSSSPPSHPHPHTSRCSVGFEFCSEDAEIRDYFTKVHCSCSLPSQVSLLVCQVGQLLRGKRWRVQDDHHLMLAVSRSPSARFAAFETPSPPSLSAGLGQLGCSVLHSHTRRKISPRSAAQHWPGARDAVYVNTLRHFIFVTSSPGADQDLDLAWSVCVRVRVRERVRVRVRVKRGFTHCSCPTSFPLHNPPCCAARQVQRPRVLGARSKAVHRLSFPQPGRPPHALVQLPVPHDQTMRVGARRRRCASAVPQRLHRCQPAI